MTIGATSDPLGDTSFTVLREEVRALIRSVAPGVQRLGDSDSLFDVGRIDSLTFLLILRTIEESYAVPVSASDVALTDFSSIQAIAAFVATHRLVSHDDG